MSHWGEFLEIRKRLIKEFRDEGKSCTEIAHILSMDPGQVWLINADNEPGTPEDARDSIISHAEFSLRNLKRI